MNAETVIVALVVSLVAPSVLAVITGRQARMTKREDWKRQDAVAAQAADAAMLLLAANERVANTAAVTNQKLDVIHTLVNSSLTAALQAELDATVRELAMMHEVIALNEAAHHRPTEASLVAIEATKARIIELRSTLADRAKQTRLADEQIRAGT